MSVTVDASVFVARGRPLESDHVTSRAFLDGLVDHGIIIYCPLLVLPETCAALARTLDDTAYALATLDELRGTSGLNLIDLNDSRANRSAQLAAELRLRGADSIYVAIAEEFGATLITLDGQMLDRAPGAVPTMTPTAWLAANPR